MQTLSKRRVGSYPNWCIAIFMEPGSQPASPSERSTSRFADFVGIVIALLTLTVPLAVIAYYSGGSESSAPTSYSLYRSHNP